MIKTEVVIIGGGVAGLMSALILGRAGISVVVVEKNKLSVKKNVTPSARTSALMQDSLGLIKDAGLWDDGLLKYCAPLETLRIVDGSVETDFVASAAGLDYFGQNIPNDVLCNQALKYLKTLETVTIMDQSALWDFEEREDDILVRLEDDVDIAAKLIIAADGKDSVTRRIAHIPCIKINHKQTAITCLINHSRSHENTSTEIHKPGGPFTLVPCPGHTSAIVWCEKDTEAERLLHLKKQDFLQALEDMSGGRLGEITLETSPKSWPLRGFVAKKLVAHRLVLIAEAAHALHPIGAQGLNLSLRDIRELTTRLIEQKSLGLDLGDLHMLKRYKHARRMDTLAHFAGVSGLCSLTSKKSKGIGRIRRAGLKMIDRSNFLKKQAIRIGLGTRAA